MNLDVTLDARQLVDSFLGGQYVERWPEADFLALHSGREVSLRCPSSCSLPACGCFCAAHPSAAQRARCPLPSTTLLAALHSRALSCTDRARRSFPQVYYVDVLEGDYFFRNGVLHAARAPPASPCVRQLNAWEHECTRMRREEGRWPTLAEQHAFLA